MTKIMEKVSLVGVIWGLMQVAYHLFITRNIALEIIWVLMTALYAIGWGVWSDES